MNRNRHVLSHGHVTCTVGSNQPLPPSVYPLLQRLAELVEEVDKEIAKALSEQTDAEEEWRRAGGPTP